MSPAVTGERNPRMVPEVQAVPEVASPEALFHGAVAYLHRLEEFSVPLSARHPLQDITKPFHHELPLRDAQGNPILTLEYNEFALRPHVQVNSLVPRWKEPHTDENSHSLHSLEHAIRATVLQKKTDGSQPQDVDYKKLAGVAVSMALYATDMLHTRLGIPTSESQKAKLEDAYARLYHMVKVANAHDIHYKALDSTETGKHPIFPEPTSQDAFVFIMNPRDSEHPVGLLRVHVEEGVSEDAIATAFQQPDISDMLIRQSNRVIPDTFRLDHARLTTSSDDTDNTVLEFVTVQEATHPTVVGGFPVRSQMYRLSRFDPAHPESVRQVLQTQRLGHRRVFLHSNGDVVREGSHPRGLSLKRLQNDVRDEIFERIRPVPTQQEGQTGPDFLLEVAAGHEHLIHDGQPVVLLRQGRHVPTSPRLEFVVDRSVQDSNMLRRILTSPVNAKLLNNFPHTFGELRDFFEVYPPKDRSIFANHEYFHNNDDLIDITRIKVSQSDQAAGVKGIIRIDYQARDKTRAAGIRSSYYVGHVEFTETY